MHWFSMSGSDSERSQAVVERRRAKRHSVSGKSTFQTASGVATGELMDIAVGSLLIRSNSFPPSGTSLQVQFNIEGHPGTFDIRARVVRTQPDVLAVVFLEEPEGLQELLKSLEAAASA